ncbi:LOW QUALITY PROTEIN: cadherin-related family member 2 [Chaetodon auriga]|uniref:LOW QUALITY PROTEIN: cadherin-related family member 2 n=1 Tax=Chaetodon auriga TaxID=39042 RepID=UPI004032F090
MGPVAGGILLFFLCLTSLTCANTTPIIQSYVYRVCEDIPKGVVAFTINATDRENDRLTYSLTEPNKEFFTVNEDNGDVSVVKDLDREKNYLMELGVIVSDGPNETPATISIILLDANNKRPRFSQSPYDISVEENFPKGTALLKVQAVDEDSGDAGLVQYSIDEVIPSRGLSLFSIGSSSGEVKLNRSLDYALNPFYQLKISATDSGGRCYYNTTTYLNSTVSAFITVVDIPNLDPEFIGLPYEGKVEEHSPVGQSVFQVTARDQDKGVNDEIKYSIENSTKDGLFSISEDYGVISVLSAIDREDTGPTVILTVKATESKLNSQGINASTTARVQINIEDINDNRPEFYKCEDSGDENCVAASNFTGKVSEHMSGFIFINMMVKDIDENSQIRLILEGDDKNVFSVEPQFITRGGMVQLLVRQPQNLDFERKQQMVLEVTAIDEENHNFNSTATVTINITDTNDNSPHFAQDTYKFSLREHSPAEMVFGTVTAVDPDTMDQGNIIYRLLPDSILPYFNVKPETGEIYVVDEALLDREVRSLYLATLVARDTHNNSGTTVLEITLTDINDQHPVINREVYLVFVAEGADFNVTIQATDGDESNTANSKIVFGIEPSRYSDNFTIDPNTGVLRNLGQLDLEVLDPKLNGQIELNVTATDSGTPPLSTVVRVNINIEDVNDNGPQFAASSYTFSVKEGEKGGFVGSVFAEDWDQTKIFNRISFSIIGGNVGSFIIRTYEEERGYRGDITVDQNVELDYDSSSKQFILQVEAADLEQVKALATVEVNLLDVNDERPKFNITQSVTVKENTTITGVVANFTGSDKDGNHSLVYELVSMNCRCDGLLTPCNSFILDRTGEVRANPQGEKLDYEKCDQVLIEAQVVDEFTEKGRNNSATTGEMVINIEDINDNAPEFIHSDSVFVVLPESTSQGTSVGAVRATDRDSEINGKITFTVTEVKFEDSDGDTADPGMLFSADNTFQDGIYVGTIQINGDIDIQKKGKYVVTVNATDSGGLSTGTKVDIHIILETYRVELEFTSSRTEVQNNLNEIIRVLTVATKATVRIVEITSDTPEASRASENTFIVAYFVYSNGTALTPAEVEVLITNPDYSLQLLELGLHTIGTGLAPTPESHTFELILLGIVGGLIIVLAVLTISMICTRRSYKRKLKAAKAMNSASKVTFDNQKSGPVVPGTNKYTMEGANPVLNLNIDTAMALDLDEDGTKAGKEKLSLLMAVICLVTVPDKVVAHSDTGPRSPLRAVLVNKLGLFPGEHFDPACSLKHVVMEKWLLAPAVGTLSSTDTDDITFSGQTKSFMHREEDNKSPVYHEPLDAALAQRGWNKDLDDRPVAFKNPVFNSIDL